MRDVECTAFLRWALPRLGLRWRGYRRVRRQACRRLARRIGELGLEGWAAYRERLTADEAEWAHVDAACRITISRFLRDRATWEALVGDVLPALRRLAASRGDRSVRAWSIGCASGEEPYTLRLAWERATEGRSGPPLTVVATDPEPAVLARAREARYETGTLRELPKAWRDRGFERSGQSWVLLPRYRDVTFLKQDVRDEQPPGPFHLVLCRNLVLTYFAAEVRDRVLERIVTLMVPGAALVIGGHEELPTGVRGLEPWRPHRSTFRRT